MRGAYLYLYLIIDVWSRRNVGWQIAERDTADVAATLIRRTCAEGNVDPLGLVLHSDNGKAMRGNTDDLDLAVAGRDSLVQPPPCL